MTPQSQGHGPELPGSADRNCGPLDPGANCPGELVEHAGLWTRSRFARDSLSTPQALGPQHESIRSVGRQRVPSHNGLIYPGQMVNPAGYRRGARVLQSAGRPRGPSDPNPIARQSWSIPRAFGPEHESPRSAGRHCGLSDSIASRPGELVDPTCPWPEPQVPGRTGRPRGPTDTSERR